jgi:hypothetical protein
MPLADLITTRFPNGLVNRNEDSIFASLKTMDPTRYHQYLEDFDYFAAANWTITETQAGATQALTDGDGGILLLTNTAADNDLISMQKVGESFLLEAGKKLFFRARFRVSDATQSDLLMGLIVADTTPFDATDGIYFQKDDGDTQLDVYCRKDATTGSTSALNIATVANDTYMTVEFFYDGETSGRLYYGVNGSVLGYLDASSTYLPDTELTVSFAIQNGEAVAKTMSVDYIFVAKERTSSTGG